MSELIAVSIIVPVYNVEKYAEMCFDSLINQKLSNIEIILVDDGSTDSSGSICDEYAKKDSRIKVVHQSNRGLGQSRNSGLKIAQGEYIGFVDSDDYVSETMFDTLYKNAISNHADASYCGYRRFSDDSAVTLQKQEGAAQLKIWSGKKQIRQYMLDRVGTAPRCKQDNVQGASVCSGIFRREKLEELKAQFVSERELIAEDMIFDIDVIPSCNTVVYTDEKLYFYRYNSNSLTTVYKKDRFDKNITLYYEMGKRLKRYYSEEEYFLSLSRYLLTVTRIAIIQEARFMKRNGKKYAASQVMEICSAPEVEAVLKKYPYRQLPLKYRIFCWLEKNKKAKILLWLANIGSSSGGKK